MDFQSVHSGSGASASEGRIENPSYGERCERAEGASKRFSHTALLLKMQNKVAQIAAIPDMQQDRVVINKG